MAISIVGVDLSTTSHRRVVRFDGLRSDFYPRAGPPSAPDRAIYLPVEIVGIFYKGAARKTGVCGSGVADGFGWESVAFVRVHPPIQSATTN